MLRSDKGGAKFSHQYISMMDFYDFQYAAGWLNEIVATTTDTWESRDLSYYYDSL